MRVRIAIASTGKENPQFGCFENISIFVSSKKKVNY